MHAVEFLHIGKIAPDPGWHLHTQIHSYHELIVAQSGKMTIRPAAGADLTLQGGQCAIYPAGAGHAERSDPDQPVATIFICFRAELSIGEIQIFDDRDGGVTRLAELLFAQRFSRDSAWHRSCLELLLLEMKHLTRQRNEEDEWLAGVHRYMQTHLGEKLTLEELARCACMSKYYFLHRYKATLGVTPVAHLRKLRCEEAGRLLIYSSVPIKEIARLTGFPDLFTLSKCLKKHYGLSPRAIREGAASLPLKNCPVFAGDTGNAIAGGE